MTKEEFIQFEKLVRTNHVFWIDAWREQAEVYRVELFENGEHGLWVRTYAKNCEGSCNLKDYKISNFRILQPINLT